MRDKRVAPCVVSVCAIAWVLFCIKGIAAAQTSIGIGSLNAPPLVSDPDLPVTSWPDFQPKSIPAAPNSTSPVDADPTEDPLYACACGCGVFSVGTPSMLPMGKGGMVWLEYDFQDQNMNWSGSSRAPAENNNDKEIRTSFITAGLQYMFSNAWGFQVEVPTAYRYFETTGGATGDEIVGNTWAALGDIRAEGIYTGFFPDLSAGIDFGFKLPTGDYTHNDAFADIDRDTEIGSGSIDALIGGFYRHNLTADGQWTVFTQVLLDVPFLGRDEYLPGVELDGSVGIYYNGLHLGKVGIVPIGQLIYSYRAQDSGNKASNPVASGYTRLLLSPGIELNLYPVAVDVDAEFPVYQHVNGNQVVAPVLVKCVFTYMF